MVIDHIGIVVRSLIDSIKYWENVFGYTRITEIVENTRQKVKVVFLEKKGSVQIKLVEAVDETSSVYRFSKKGGGLHHICFLCDDVETGVKKMKEVGIKLLSPPQPGEAFCSENIAFLYAKNNLNIELIDTKKREKKLESLSNKL